jgi:hypothetical protein
MTAIAYITRQGIRYRSGETGTWQTFVLHGCGENSIARM